MNRLNLSRCAINLCVTAILLAGCSLSEPPVGAPATNALTRAQVPARLPTDAVFESWRSMLLQIPKPENACMVATYPERQWQATPCVEAPNIPLVPANGIRHETVAKSIDYSGKVKTGSVSFAYGLFQQMTGVKSEYVQISGQRYANLYSLQINTQPFTTTACTTLGSTNPKNCQGWEQFVYDTTNYSDYQPGVFIQYWLLDFGKLGTQCPSSPSYWYTYFPPEKNYVDCYINYSETVAPVVVITQLTALTLLGGAPHSYFGNKDGAGMSDIDNGKLFLVVGNNWFPDLGKRWQYAEFNVLGNGGGDEAIFNAGSRIVVRTLLSSGTTNAPTVKRRPSQVNGTTSPSPELPSSGERVNILRSYSQRPTPILRKDHAYPKGREAI